MAKERKEFSCQSPVQDDYNRVVNYDEAGKEYISYEKVNYPKLQASLGSYLDWSLQSLMKAGIDPAFPIHTGNPTRLEGIDELSDIVADLDNALANLENTDSNDSNNS